MWLKIGPTGLPSVFCVQRTHAFPTIYECDCHAEKKNQTTVEKEKVVRVEAKSQGLGRPAPPDPRRGPRRQANIYMQCPWPGRFGRTEA